MEVEKRKFELVDTDEEFYIKIDGNEIPYITEYSITARKQEGFIDIDIKISIPNNHEINIRSQGLGSL